MDIVEKNSILKFFKRITKSQHTKTKQNKTKVPNSPWLTQHCTAAPRLILQPWSGLRSQTLPDAVMQPLTLCQSAQRLGEGSWQHPLLINDMKQGRALTSLSVAEMSDGVSTISPTPLAHQKNKQQKNQQQQESHQICRQLFQTNHVAKGVCGLSLDWRWRCQVGSAV